MLKSIGIKRLRSLWDTDLIKIAPLTILVGKNSCGKSTWLRSFPLLSQTLQTNTNEPVLWYDRNMVDFGSFDESLSKFKKYGAPQDINFSFEVTSTRVIKLDLFPHGRVQKEYSILISKHIDKSSLTKEIIDIFDYSIEVDLNKKIIIVKIEDIEFEESFSILGRIGKGFFLPILFGQKDDKNLSVLHKIMKNKLIEFIRPNLHKSTSTDTIERSLRVFHLSSIDDFDHQLYKQANVAKTSGLKRFYKNLLSNKNDKNKFISLFILSSIDIIFEIEKKELSTFYDNLTYVAPVRASAERYYRIQGLAINKIDPLGINVPLYLYDLKQKRKKDYSNWTEWTRKNFGLEFDIEANFGHISLFFVDIDTQGKYNLSDVGFGYSQIVPILINLWDAQNYDRNQLSFHRLAYRGRRKTITKTITIEQPELHLHPAMQAKLIKVFFNTIVYAYENDIDLRIIIETHSETMINYLGRVVADCGIDGVEELINILVFNPETPEKSNISISGFNKQGYLKNWPIGFFTPDLDI